jgi:hypothetical protein
MYSAWSHSRAAVEPTALGLAERRQGVGGLPALGDAHDQRVVGDWRGSGRVLAGEKGLGGYARLAQGLGTEQGGVIAGPASDELNGVGVQPL